MNVCARIVVLGLAFSWSLEASAQRKPVRSGDLDVTMQVIVDPDVKLPDEVVRRIPLPTSTRTGVTADKSPKSNASEPESKGKGSERAQEARELGREAGQSGRERAKEAAEQRAEQREAARNARAEQRPEHPPHPDNPGRPGPPERPTPPGQQPRN